ncbi:MAG: extracellular solute-binding protein [Anaerolineaceae bacterium]|nr:extracellular solute-binding protein [Anaerolineaceae bacterium]
MKTDLKIVTLIVLLLLSAACLSACQTGKQTSQVVIYTSVDQIYSEPILKAFEEQSGVQVLAVYDVEAAKTTGLVNRLIAEMNNPQADVFWNGEFAQTLLLQEQGILAAYLSPEAVDIPAQYRDPGGYWTGIAARARVLIVNTDLLSPEYYPTSIHSLLETTWPSEQIGIANPLFGTSASHAAALYAAWGGEAAVSYFSQLKDQGVRILDGNSVVRDLVARGQLAFGLSDTDDACAAIKRGDPLAIVFPDQEDDALGTLIIPGTVAMVAGGPNPEQARALIDFLVSIETERMLVESGWSHIPMRPLGIDFECVDASGVRGMDVSLAEVYSQLERVKSELAEIFIR